jgi:HEAT repeat protein
MPRCVLFTSSPGQPQPKDIHSYSQRSGGFHRRAAAEALENVDDSRATQPLLAVLKDEDPTVRVSAIHALALAVFGGGAARHSAA